jgi:hypothetical protein
MASKIAAFASGVAPVRRGLADADEDAIPVEEVLHKLETAGRVRVFVVLFVAGSAAAE